MFIKENFIGKEEAETVAKVKLVRKIRKHNQLYFGTLVLLLQSYPIQNVGWGDGSREFEKGRRCMSATMVDGRRKF